MGVENDYFELNAGEPGPGDSQTTSTISTGTRGICPDSLRVTVHDSSFSIVGGASYVDNFYGNTHTQFELSGHQSTSSTRGVSIALDYSKQYYHDPKPEGNESVSLMCNNLHVRTSGDTTFLEMSGPLLQTNLTRATWQGASRGDASGNHYSQYSFGFQHTTDSSKFTVMLIK